MGWMPIPSEAHRPSFASTKPPDRHLRSQFQDTSSKEIFYILTHGIAGTAMIPATELSEDARWAGVAFLATWPPSPEQPGTHFSTRDQWELLASEHSIYSECIREWKC